MRSPAQLKPVQLLHVQQIQPRNARAHPAGTHATGPHSMLSPSLSFHLVSMALLGCPNGSTTLRATSTPAIGKFPASSNPSYGEETVVKASVLRGSGRMNFKVNIPALARMLGPSNCAHCLSDSYRLGKHRTHMCLKGTMSPKYLVLSHRRQRKALTRMSACRRGTPPLPQGQLPAAFP